MKKGLPRCVVRW